MYGSVTAITVTAKFFSGLVLWVNSEQISCLIYVLPPSLHSHFSTLINFQTLSHPFSFPNHTDLYFELFLCTSFWYFLCCLGTLDIWIVKSPLLLSSKPQNSSLLTSLQSENWVSDILVAAILQGPICWLQTEGKKKTSKHHTRKMPQSQTNSPCETGYWKYKGRR